MRIAKFCLISLLFTSAFHIDAAESLPMPNEFTVECNSMVFNGASRESKIKFIGRDGDIIFIKDNGEEGKRSKVIEADWVKGSDLGFEQNYVSFNAVNVYEHITGYDSILYNVQRGSLTWKSADINTSRNLLVAANNFEFQNCLNIGFN